MNEIVAVRSGYCVPAVVEMALRYYDYQIFNQEQIAQELIRITEQNYETFLIEGMKLKQGDLNKFFAENNFKIAETYISFHHILDEVDFIEKCLSELKMGVFLICGYNYSRLWESKNKSAQHVSVIIGIEDERSVLIYDPGPEDFGIKKVLADKLWDAIRAANDGIWCIYSNF